MTALDEVQRQPPPRDEALCNRLARRLDPAWGFVAYGVLWFFVACALCTGVLMLGLRLLGDHPARAATHGLLVLYFGTFAASWWIFARWVRAHRAGSRALVREGVLLTAKLEGVRRIYVRGAPVTVAGLTYAADDEVRTLRLSVPGHPPALVDGVEVPLLRKPHHPYAVAFPPPGDAIPCADVSGPLRVLEDSPNRLVLEHRSARSSRFTVGLLMFMAASCLIVAPLLALSAALAPATRFIECDRHTGSCRSNGQWAHVEDFTFPVGQLSKLQVEKDAGGYALAAIYDGRPQYWSGAVHAPAEVEALRRAVAELNAFPGGAAKTVRVELPNGRPMSPWVLGFVAAFGLLMLLGARRTVWSLRLDADRGRGTLRLTRRRVFGRTRVDEMPLGAFSAVETRFARTPPARRVEYTAVTLAREPAAPVVVFEEPTTPAVALAARALAGALGRFLGVPVEGG